MRNIIRFNVLWFVAAISPAFWDSTWAATAVESTDAAGNRVVVMENAALKLTINPAAGGRVSSFIWKATGKDWVLPGNSGFFMDHVWQQSWPGELLGRSYDVKILPTEPGTAAVSASVVIEGSGDKTIAGVRLTRTMTLTDDSPRVIVTYRFENPTPEPRAPGPWVQNVIAVGGARDDAWTFRPTTRGIITASWSDSKGTVLPAGYKDDFCFDPVAGWSAEVYTPTGEGIVFFMDYNNLRCLYNNGGSQSVEWWLEQVRLAPGKAWETTVELFAFQGLKGVTYASPQVLGYLEMQGEGPTIVLRNQLLAGPQPVAGALSLKLQLLDYDTGKELFARQFPQLHLGAAPIVTEATAAHVPAGRNLLARATVTLPDGKSVSYEQYRAAPGVMGTEKAYRIAKPRRERAVERPPVIAKTPHEGFNILHLRGLYHDYYRLPEAARLLGARLECGSYRVFVYGPSLSYFPGSYDELMNFDVIVLNNVPAEAIDEVTMQYLSDYVENGGALLVIGGHWAFGGGGYKGTPLEELLPVTSKGPFDVRRVRNGSIRPALSADHRVGTLWIQDVIVRPEAQVTMTAGDKPFWIQWRKGKGVVAVMTGLCYGEGFRNLCPFWEWPGWPNWFGKQLQALSAGNRSVGWRYVSPPNLSWDMSPETPGEFVTWYAPIHIGDKGFAGDTYPRRTEHTLFNPRPFCPNLREWRRETILSEGLYLRRHPDRETHQELQQTE